MSETEEEVLDQTAIDPPDNQSGGGSQVTLETANTTDGEAIDPPDNQGGGGA